MDFTTIEYLLFLPLAVLGYYIIPHTTRWIALVAFSTFFLFQAHPLFPVILAGVVFVTHFSAKAIHTASNQGKKNVRLTISVCLLLGLMAVFKFDHWLVRLFGDRIEGPLFAGSGWLVPLGLSYYLFQAIGYLIEIKRGQQEPEKHIGKLAAYLAFFPKLLAGPIERAHHFLPQLNSLHTPGWGNFRMGFRLILWGLFKKMVIGDRLSVLISPVFNHPDQFGGAATAMAMVLFPVQLYADFSGYTDIAIGSARLFGFELSANFNRPFCSRSVSEFWRRWHITLSSWVNDYIFTPLSLWFTMRHNWGKMGLFLALLASFLLLGLWHGPFFTFAVFGLLQGFAVLLETGTKKTRLKLVNSLPKGVGETFGGLITFGFFSIACVFFLAPSLEFAFAMFEQLGTTTFWNQEYQETHFHFSGLLLSLNLTALFLAADHLVFTRGFENWVKDRNLLSRWLIYGILIFGVVALSGVEATPFIYQQF